MRKAIASTCLISLLSFSLVLTSCSALLSVTSPLLREIGVAAIRWSIACALEHQATGVNFASCVRDRGRGWIESRLGSVLDDLFGGVGGGNMGGELSREVVHWIQSCALAGDLSIDCVDAKGQAWALENAPDLVEEISALIRRLLGQPLPVDLLARDEDGQDVAGEIAARVQDWVDKCNTNRDCVIERAERWIGDRPDAARLKAAVRMALN